MRISYLLEEHLVKVEGEDKLYYCIHDIDWMIGKYDSNHKETIKSGTPFDVSIPWSFKWPINPHNTDTLYAAAIHDNLLNEGHDPSFASAEFRRALIARNKGAFTSWVMFFSTLFWTVISQAIRNKKIKQQK